MTEFLSKLFSSDFIPHGHCFGWAPDVLWLNVAADSLIALAYYTIPIALIVLARKRPDISYHWVFFLFAAFIFLCGTTHLFDVWTVWHGTYRMQGALKLLTALVSAATAVVLWPIIPRIAALPSLDQLHREITTKEQARAELQTSHADLARTVSEQTDELGRATKELRRLAQIVGASYDAIISGTLDGIVSSWNKGATRMFGYTEQEMLGKPISILFPPPHSKEWELVGERILSGEKFVDYECELRQKDGSLIHASLAISPMHTNKGSLEAVSLIARDITERKKLDERFRLAVEAAPNAMILANEQGNIVLVNRQAEQLFGYSPEEFMRITVEELVPERSRPLHGKYRHGFLNKPEARPMGKGRELFGIRKNGTEVPVEIGLTPIKSSEGALVIAAVVDITERKEAQQRIENSLRDKDLLLREVHHRVKNNLQVISSLLKLQANSLTDKEARGLLHESEERVRSMALVHEKLYNSNAFSKVNFKAYVEDLTRELLRGYAIKPENIHLTLNVQNVELDIESAIPCGLLLNELVSNALKHAFSAQTEGELTISLVSVRGRTTLIVADNGKGLPLDIDIHSPRTLGLQVVTTLCSQLGAELSVAREGGTSFAISFGLENEKTTIERRSNNGASESPHM